MVDGKNIYGEPVSAHDRVVLTAKRQAIMAYRVGARSVLHIGMRHGKNLFRRTYYEELCRLEGKSCD